MERVVSNTKVSVNEFREMLFDDDYFYEVIEGCLIQKSGNAPSHQTILKQVFFQLETFNREHKNGLLFFSPLDVFLDDYNKPQPDLIFVAGSRVAIINDEGIARVPDLIVEVISPASVLRDRIEKKNVYERIGVQEFWLIDPQYEAIEIYTLQDDRYHLYSAATTSEGVLKSEIFPELKVEIRDIFSATA